MKKLLILFVLPLLVYSCSEGDKKSEANTETAEQIDTVETVEMIRNDWANEHMLGQVKSFEETSFTPDEKGKIGKMDSCCVETEEYNKTGFMKRITKKNMDGKVTEVGVAEHTETGQFAAYTRTKDGKEVFKRVVQRNDAGESTGATDTDSTQQVTRIHKLDKMNEYNQAVSGKSYAADETYLGTWTWQYIDGQRVGNSWTDSTGVVMTKRIGEVNDKGWISKATVAKVDENGKKTTVVETYTYDSIDEMGNWTQRTEYNDNKPVEVLKRTYAYYED